MKILHNCIAGYLGYYGNLEALQSQYPEGGEAGSFFLNGETSTLWMWNPVTQCWNDTNYTTAPDLVGMIIEPSTFVPSIIPGKEALYYYVATAAGSYGFPKLPGTSIKIEVSCTQPSIILLRWDGTKWEEHVYPFALSPLTYHRYRGLWDENETYCRNNDYIDVVLYNGQYYRLVLFGKHSKITPDTEHIWEVIDGFSVLATGLQVIEQDGNGTLVLSPEMCSLRITNPAGKELANLSIQKGTTENDQYVQQSFTSIVGDTINVTTINATGITFSEGTVSSLGAVIINKRYFLSVDGPKDTPI